MDFSYVLNVFFLYLQVLLKAEGIKRCKNRFYRLDVNKTLKENLQDKTLVEYPLIYVSYDDHLEAFDIIDSGMYKQYETIYIHLNTLFYF